MADIRTYSVHVASMPGTRKEVFVTEGTTVAEAIELAELTLSSDWQVRLNGSTVTNPNSQTVRSGDNVTLTRQIKGNS